MPGAFGLLACLDDQPVGLAIALAGGPDAELLTLAVRPDSRRRGVASRLLTSTGSRARNAGCERLLLEVAEDNQAARALYSELGFLEVGRRPCYFRRPNGRSVTAIVMARPLRP
jgi:ribosomal-protein-alanine N-acetyltransferase